MASKIEPLVVETLYGLAEVATHDDLRILLQVNRADWSRMSRTEQRRILGVAFDAVRYDHRTMQLTLRRKTESTDAPLEELSVPLSTRLFEPRVPRATTRVFEGTVQTDWRAWRDCWRWPTD